MKNSEAQRRGFLTRWLLYPLLKLLRFLKRTVERLIRDREQVSPSEMIEEELQTLIDEGVQEGVMDRDDEELLHSAIEFGDTLAREVMVPRMDMIAIEEKTPLGGVLEAVISVGHTRLPVYRESIDRIVGILHSKDLIKVWQSGLEDVALSELLRPVIFFPGDKRISVLLHKMKKDRTHLAIVVDEFGGTAGLITLEDLVEEIIGEVEDEFDQEGSASFQVKDEGWLLDSRMGLWELSKRLGLPRSLLEETKSETVGGLMSELLGRLPRAGEEVPFGPYRFRVTQTDGRRVLKVEVKEIKG